MNLSECPLRAQCAAFSPPAPAPAPGWNPNPTSPGRSARRSHLAKVGKGQAQARDHLTARSVSRVPAANRKSASFRRPNTGACEWRVVDSGARPVTPRREFRGGRRGPGSRTSLIIEAPGGTHKLWHPAMAIVPDLSKSSRLPTRLLNLERHHHRV